jgi:predicted ABC-class ATPase
MSSNADTKPTLETVLERIDSLRQEVNKRFDDQDRNFADFDVRIDRIESVVNATRSEMLTLRADFREFKQKVEEVTRGAA